MITMHNRSVNVDRKELLKCLKVNLETHKKDYEEAVQGYKTKLIIDLDNAINLVKTTNPHDLKSFTPVQFNFPPCHISDYEEIISMLEMSVDVNINLDSDSFKAYAKNEWSWSRGFNITANLYKSFNGN